MSRKSLNAPSIIRAIPESFRGLILNRNCSKLLLSFVGLILLASPSFSQLRGTKNVWGDNSALAATNNMSKGGVALRDVAKRDGAQAPTPTPTPTPCGTTSTFSNTTPI